MPGTWYGASTQLLVTQLESSLAWLAGERRYQYVDSAMGTAGGEGEQCY